MFVRQNAVEAIHHARQLAAPVAVARLVFSPLRKHLIRQIEGEQQSLVGGRLPPHPVLNFRQGLPDQGFHFADMCLAAPAGDVEPPARNGNVEPGDLGTFGVFRHGSTPVLGLSLGFPMVAPAARDH
ncbi:MAG: hypothetical protein V3S29_08445 [bacterium]